jgi:hypothetical protein
VVYLVELVCFVGLSVPALVVFVAGAMALKHVDKSMALIGGLFGVASEITALAVGSSPQSLNGGLVVLSTAYQSATTPEERAGLASAADAIIATTNAMPWAGVLTAAGILALSLAAWRGPVPAAVAAIGIITGAVGIAAESLRPLIDYGYLIYGLLLPTWFILTGWTLHTLGRHPRVVSQPRTDESAEGRAHTADTTDGTDELLERPGDSRPGPKSVVVLRGTGTRSERHALGDGPTAPTVRIAAGTNPAGSTRDSTTTPACRSAASASAAASRRRRDCGGRTVIDHPVRSEALEPAATTTSVSQPTRGLMARLRRSPTKDVIAISRCVLSPTVGHGHSAHRGPTSQRLPSSNPMFGLLVGDFALVAMLRPFGLRIFEATAPTSKTSVIAAGHRQRDHTGGPASTYRVQLADSTSSGRDPCDIHISGGWEQRGPSSGARSAG